MQEIGSDHLRKLPLRTRVAYLIITLSTKRGVKKNQKDIALLLDVLGNIPCLFDRGVVRFRLLISGGDHWHADIIIAPGPYPEKQYEFNGLGATPAKACMDLITGVVNEFNANDFYSGSKKKRLYPQNEEFCTHEDFERDVHSPAAQLSDVLINICTGCGKHL